MATRVAPAATPHTALKALARHVRGRKPEGPARGAASSRVNPQSLATSAASRQNLTSPSSWEENPKAKAREERWDTPSLSRYVVMAARVEALPLSSPSPLRVACMVIPDLR